MGADRSNKEGVFLGDSGNGVGERDLTIGVAEDSAISNGDTDRGTWTGFKIELLDKGVVYEVQGGSAV